MAEEEKLNDLDRKIERINILQAVTRIDLIPEDLGGNVEVIVELNAKVREFLTSMLLSEFTGVALPGGQPHPLLALEWTPERAEVVKLLVDRALNRPSPAPAQAAPPAPAEPPVNEIESVHVPLLEQRGTAVAKTSRRGNLITDILKQNNPNLLVPTDPQFKALDPEARADAMKAFNQAVRDHEAKMKEKFG